MVRAVRRRDPIARGVRAQSRPGWRGRGWRPASGRSKSLYHKFIQRFKISFETARDPESNIGSSYGTFQIPETYLIDRHGKVIEKVISNKNWMDPDFLAQVRKLAS